MSNNKFTYSVLVENIDPELLKGQIEALSELSTTAIGYQDHILGALHLLENISDKIEENKIHSKVRTE